MQLSDFVLNQSTGVYLPPAQSGKTSDKFLYTDGRSKEAYMLDCLKHAEDLTDDSLELQNKATKWAFLYHLGQGRSTIFKALGLQGDLKVLELGAGCGALSRYLGENCKSVDGIESSHVRAQIAKERCRNLDNVNIFSCDIFDVEFQPVYDIVTLIGVWEYAPLFSNESAEEACSKLLEQACSALKPDGVLIIAIENKIGLKYWTGAPEEHSGRFYDGIHGYPIEKEPITFSKSEIRKYLTQVQLKHIHFYHCFPDYKFGNIFFSDIGEDEKLYLYNWITVPFPHSSSRKYDIHEGLTLRTLSRAGLLREFANSFLVTASKSQASALLKPDWIAKKITVYPRKKQYQCITALKPQPQLHVEKEYVYPKLAKDRNINCESGEYPNIIHHADGSEWYSGDLLMFDVYEALYNGDFTKRCGEILRQHYQQLHKLFYTGKEDAAGYPLMQGKSFDFILHNIVKNESGPVFIDTEWSADKDLPADFILFRSIKGNIIAATRRSEKVEIKNRRKFTIEMLKTLFDQYNNERYEYNRKLEKHLQRLATTKSAQSTIVKPKYAFWKHKKKHETVYHYR